MADALSIQDSARGEGVRGLNLRKCGRGVLCDSYHLRSAFSHSVCLSHPIHFVRNTLRDINSGRSEHRSLEILLSIPFDTLNCLGGARSHLHDECPLFDYSISITLISKRPPCRSQGELVFLYSCGRDVRGKTSVILGISEILYITIAEIYREVTGTLVVSWLGGRFLLEQKSWAFLGQLGLGEASLSLGVYGIRTGSQTEFCGI